MSADPLVAAKDSALQHGAARRTPRPLPLFLDMVARVAQTDPELARRAIAGMEVYGAAVRPPAPARPVLARAGRASLLDGGGDGPPVVLVPSLINSSRVLDLDDGRSLLAHLAARGFRAMLVDWGNPAVAHRSEDIGDHVTGLLRPLVEAVGEPVHLIGYCLGGTMTVALATMLPVRSLTLMATPWHFGRYPADARGDLQQLWQRHSPAVDAIGLAPVELLQTAFWSLDAQRTVAKFAALAGRASKDADVVAFAALEDWANEGAPLTAAAAADLFDQFIASDWPGKGRWRIDGRCINPGRLPCPALHFTAANDRIAPAATAPEMIRSVACPSGHVGMIVGSRAEAGLRRPLITWLAQH